jgi:hypothetical protein
MIYMGIMLEKWPNKGQEYLKYMYNVRLATERVPLLNPQHVQTFCGPLFPAEKGAFL